jgi:hypothetical protein
MQFIERQCNLRQYETLFPSSERGIRLVIGQVDDRSDEMYFIGEGRLEVHVPRRPTARSGPTMRRKRTEANGASPGAKGTLTAAPDDVRAQVRFSIKHCASMKDPAEVEEVFVKMGELQVTHNFLTALVYATAGRDIQPPTVVFLNSCLISDPIYASMSFYPFVF